MSAQYTYTSRCLLLRKLSTPPSTLQASKPPLARRYYSQLWRLRLSNCKQVALGAVERCQSVLDKLDQLRVFLGLWDGLQLGNIQKNLALHATDELLRYLQYIYNVWDRLTLHEPAV